MMMELKEIHSNEELEQAFEKSLEKPVLLFKHSTTCPISAGAFSAFHSFIRETDKNIGCYLVKVIEDRSVSNQVASITDVKHESPQLFVIQNREVKWHTSHSMITVESIEEALEGIKG